jgi:predicted LPLAT superfamily acyltransferase
MYEGKGASVALFRGLNPMIADKIIQIGNLGAMLQVKEALDGGEMVGILGDRIVRGDKTVTAPFLGAPAAFSAGPYVLSTLLEAPIVLCFGLYLGGRRYEILFEPFCDGVRLSREHRDAEIRALVARYAERLEAYCRRQPFNWFNFYDFWQSGSGDEAPSREA